MNNNKQTFNHNSNQSSVEWLIGEIIRHQMTFYGTSSMPVRIIEQAKAMHKEESFKTFKAGQDSMEEGGKGFDQWYQETFGGNNEQQ